MQGKVAAGSSKGCGVCVMGQQVCYKSYCAMFHIGLQSQEAKSTQSSTNWHFAWWFAELLVFIRCLSTCLHMLMGSQMPTCTGVLELQSKEGKKSADPTIFCMGDLWWFESIVADVQKGHTSFIS